MHSGSTVSVLRIYIGESHYHQHVPVYEAIVYRARERKLAGATVFKSSLGFGGAELRPSQGQHPYRVSDDAPAIVEIVDQEDRLQDFMPVVRDMLGNRGLVTLHTAAVLHYSAAVEK
ncbi:MAG: DUF190 domain-containing protein [Alphaproteobacteria bacterium]|nr:DUF190 domain-containing protein [Alphaproteobacteria bacterium]